MKEGWQILLIDPARKRNRSAVAIDRNLITFPEFLAVPARDDQVAGVRRIDLLVGLQNRAEILPVITIAPRNCKNEVVRKPILLPLPRRCSAAEIAYLAQNTPFLSSRATHRVSR